jgi:hypothetical protein
MAAVRAGRRQRWEEGKSSGECRKKDSGESRHESMIESGGESRWEEHW